MEIDSKIVAALLKAQFSQDGPKHFYKTLDAQPLIGHTKLCVYIDQADATDEPELIEFAVEFDACWPLGALKWDVREAFTDLGGIAPHGEEVKRAMPAILALFEQAARADFMRILHNDNLLACGRDQEMDLEHRWM